MRLSILVLLPLALAGCADYDADESRDTDADAAAGNGAGVGELSTNMTVEESSNASTRETAESTPTPGDEASGG